MSEKTIHTSAENIGSQEEVLPRKPETPGEAAEQAAAKMENAERVLEDAMLFYKSFSADPHYQDPVFEKAAAAAKSNAQSGLNGLKVEFRKQLDEVFAGSNETSVESVPANTITGTTVEGLAVEGVSVTRTEPLPQVNLENAENVVIGGREKENPTDFLRKLGEEINKGEGNKNAEENVEEVGQEEARNESVNENVSQPQDNLQAIADAVLAQKENEERKKNAGRTNSEIGEALKNGMTEDEEGTEERAGSELTEAVNNFKQKNQAEELKNEEEPKPETKRETRQERRDHVRHAEAEYGVTTFIDRLRSLNSSKGFQHILDRWEAKSSYKKAEKLKVSIARAKTFSEGKVEQIAALKENIDHVSNQLEKLETDTNVSDADRPKVKARLEAERAKFEKALAAAEGELEATTKQLEWNEAELKTWERRCANAASEVVQTMQERIAPEKERMEQIAEEIERTRTKIFACTEFYNHCISEMNKISAERNADKKLSNIKERVKRRMEAVTFWNLARKRGNDISSLKSKMAEFEAEYAKIQSRVVQWEMETGIFSGFKKSPVSETSSPQAEVENAAPVPETNVGNEEEESESTEGYEGDAGQSANSNVIGNPVREISQDQINQDVPLHQEVSPVVSAYGEGTPIIDITKTNYEEGGGKKENDGEAKSEKPPEIPRKPAKRNRGGGTSRSKKQGNNNGSIKKLTPKNHVARTSK